MKVLIQLCDASSDPKIRVRCIGTLECLAQYPESIEGNRVRNTDIFAIIPLTIYYHSQLIADYLLSILPTSTTPSPLGTEPLVQVLSALIDIYSDENMPYDTNFRQGGYLGKLAASVDGVKKSVRAIDRRKEGGKELRRRGEEMRDNLVAFIQYRRDLKL